MMKPAQAVMLRQLVPILVAMSLPAASPADDALPEMVGSYSDPTHLIFKGNTPFTDAELHGAVESDLQIQLLSSPSSPLSDYLSLLKSRLLQGFLRSGFDHPSVDVRPDITTGNIVVTLEPGKRWNCGKVIVNGANTVPADTIIKWFTEPIPPSTFQGRVDDQEISVSSQPASNRQPDNVKPAYREWVAGGPAPFDDFRAARMTRFVRWQLAELGYLHPFVRVYVEAGEKDANLVIRLIDEGPRATLHNIDFATLSRNTPEDVQAFLKIAPGDAVTLDRLSGMQQQLWDSGRFLRDTISVEQIPNDLTHVNLHVKIDEADGVPPLKDLLPETDQALLRFRKWCLSAGADGDDVVADFSQAGMHAKFVWGGTGGCALRATFPSPQKDSTSDTDKLLNLLGEDRDVGIAMTSKVAGVYLPAAGAKCEGRCDPSMLTVSASFATSDDADAKRPFQLSFSGSIDTNADASAGGSAGVHCLRWFEPVAFLGLQQGYKSKADIAGGVLTVRSDSLVIHIDAATGRLIDATTTNALVGRIVRCDVEHGALDAMAKDLQAAPSTNTRQSDQFFGALLGFAAAMYCHSNLVAANEAPEQHRALAQISARVLDAKVLAPLDNMLEGIFGDGTNGFTLPVDEDFTQPGGLAGMAGGYGLQINSRLFASRTWPATLLRCFCFYLIDRGQAVGPEMDRLYADPDSGPLACLVTAELLHWRFPQPSQSFARHGLGRLSADAFAKDCSAMFAGNAQMSSLAIQLVDNLRKLTDADVQALASQLSPKPAAALNAFIAKLRSHQGLVTEQLIRDALSRAWTAGLQDSFESELNRLAAGQ
jgi:hypothetical protein